jgi:RNA polymerase sigma-70 factor, ECF subfamily
LAEATANQTTPSIEDAQLVQQVLQGERAAFNALVTRHQRGLYFLCLRISKGEAEAQDLCQRAFLRAFESLKSFRGESAFKTWLYRIAVNLSKNFLRDSGRRAEVAIEDEVFAMSTNEQSAEARVLDAEEKLQLHRLIDTLPEKQKATLQLRVYEDLSFAEISQVLGGTEGAAKVNFHYAVQALKKLMHPKTASTGKS